MAKAPKASNRHGEPQTVSRGALLVRGSDMAFRQFVHDTLAFAARIQAIRNALGKVIGLSGTQYTILIAVAREMNKKGIGINYIAEQLHFSPAFVTIEVNKLVAAKLISKKENPQDRRRVLLATTPKAMELLESLTIVQRPVNDMLFESLGTEDFDCMRRKTPEMVDSADRALQLFDFMAANAGGTAPSRSKRRDS